MGNLGNPYGLLQDSPIVYFFLSGLDAIYSIILTINLTIN